MLDPDGAQCAAAAQVASDVALWGNRLTARAVGGGCLLVAHPEGRIGERIVLSRLGATVSGRWQVCDMFMRRF